MSDTGRPPARTDVLIKTAGSRWMQLESDQSRWKSIGEAYVQQWAATGCYDDVRYTSEITFTRRDEYFLACCSDFCQLDSQKSKTAKERSILLYLTFSNYTSTDDGNQSINFIFSPQYTLIHLHSQFTTIGKYTIQVSIYCGGLVPNLGS